MSTEWTLFFDDKVHKFMAASVTGIRTVFPVGSFSNE